MCIDFRTISANTTIEAYLIPYIDSGLDCLGGSIILSEIDLAQGYH